MIVLKNKQSINNYSYDISHIVEQENCVCSVIVSGHSSLIPHVNQRIWVFKIEVEWDSWWKHLIIRGYDRSFCQIRDCFIIIFKVSHAGVLFLLKSWTTSRYICRTAGICRCCIGRIRRIWCCRGIYNDRYNWSNAHLLIINVQKASISNFYLMRNSIYIILNIYIGDVIISWGKSPLGDLNDSKIVISTVFGSVKVW